jgi:endonuclease YncB( thermonuclease family)
VNGQTVRIERQATDTDTKGNWVRDVWVQNEDGGYTLVANALVSEGAVEAAISEPNTRFAGWLTSSQATAQAAGTGMWATCGAAGDISSSAASGTNASSITAIKPA